MTGLIDSRERARGRRSTAGLHGIGCTTRRAAVHALLEGSARTRRAQLVSTVLAALILGNVVAVVFESWPPVARAFSAVFFAIEAVSVAVFSVEYLVRLWCCVEDPRFAHPVLGRLRYLFQPLTVIDLLAIAPFYAPMLFPVDLRTLRLLRLARLARLLKLGRYSDSVALYGQVLREKKEELVLSAAGTMLLLIVAASLMYAFEHEVQPGAFSSIPATMWWGVATITNAGYGDVVPMTTAGKLLSGLVAVLGVGVFAVPTGVVAAGFDEVARRKKGERRCRHCGAKVDED